MQKIWGKHTFRPASSTGRYYSNLTTGGNVDITTDRRMTTQYYDNIAGTAWLRQLAAGPGQLGPRQQLAGPASLQGYWGAYVQDDFQAEPETDHQRGHRWDFEPPRTERFDRQIVWRDEKYKWTGHPIPAGAGPTSRSRPASPSTSPVDEDGIMAAQPCWEPRVPDSLLPAGVTLPLRPRGGAGYQFCREPCFDSGTDWTG